MTPGRWAAAAAALALAVASPPSPASARQADEGGGRPTSCVACHTDEEWFDEPHQLVETFADDVHAAVGLSCHDCHGGDPDPARAEDLDAMDPGYEPNPYVGIPETTAIPELCGRCHSDPTFMRRYQPDPRVDQEREYRTSQHGEALAEGDTAVATCVSCHRAHGVRRTDDPASPVYPTEVARTCRTCHEDAERMDGRTTPDGRPLPIDQYGRWMRSVHANALFERGDLSAPTCNDCHGNHGAAPPGLDSIAFVCGQCHGREAELFRASPKRTGFEEHASFVEGLGEEACAACHDESEPAASFSRPHAFTECSSCHGHHAIVRPTVAMLSPLPADPCAFCHGDTGPEASEEQGERRQSFEEVHARLENEMAEAGLTGEERFDRMVDRLLELPQHRVRGGESGLVPEFEELFDKFRIGRTRFTFEGPTGETLVEGVVRCSDCHAAEPMLATEPVGHQVSRAFVERSRELTARIATAQRAFLTAKRGGVETRDALAALESAVDAQIRLEVLVHTFSAAEDGEFVTLHGEGMEQASTALEEARAALDELAFRRRGLALSLVFVALLLVALALKIRHLGMP